MLDPYEVLGVSRDADSLTIRRAYQKLARRWHPALNGGDPRAERSFKAVSRAYAMLAPEGGDADSGRGAKGTVVGSVRRRRARFTAPDLAYRFEELVVELLPAGSDSGADDRRGSLDVHSEVTLDFAEALRGVVVSLSVQREMPCGRCRGGVRGCEACEGRGFEVRLERVRVRIPPGASDGSRVRANGQGNLSADGRGDLYVVVRVRPHAYFRRDGADIHARLPITVAEASLGATVRAPTIDGPVEVSIPPGTQGGQRIRLAGKGVVRGDGSRGDHYYQTELIPPPGGAGENRALLERLEQADPRADLPDRIL